MPGVRGEKQNIHLAVWNRWREVWVQRQCPLGLYAFIYVHYLKKKKIEMTMNEMQHNKLKAMVKEIREKIKTL